MVGTWIERAGYGGGDAAICEELLMARGKMQVRGLGSDSGMGSFGSGGCRKEESRVG